MGGFCPLFFCYEYIIYLVENKLRNYLFYRNIALYIVIYMSIATCFIYFKYKINTIDEAVEKSHQVTRLLIRQELILEKLKSSEEREPELTKLSENSAVLTQLGAKQNSYLDNELLKKISLINEKIQKLIGTLPENNVISLLEREIDSAYKLSLKRADKLRGIKKEVEFKIFTYQIIFMFILFIISVAWLKGLMNKIDRPIYELNNYIKNFSLNKHNELSSNTYRFNELNELKYSILEMKDRILLEDRSNQRSMKSNTIEEISGNVAHIINNPLTIIAGSARLLKKRQMNEESRVMEVDNIIQAVNRISDATNSVKKLMRTSDKKEMKEFPSSRIKLATNLYFMNRFIENNINIIFDLPDDVMIYAVENEILQVVFSLVENSINFISQNKLSITDKWIKIYIKEVSNSKTLYIEDCGQNICSDLIFSSMMSPSSKKLGLHYVFTTVERNKATIDFKSVPNSTFSIRFQ